MSKEDVSRYNEMMVAPLFVSLGSAKIAHEMFGARKSVCYAAPGILKEPADALAALARRIGPSQIVVCLDFDERVMRMGYGELAAVSTLRDAGIEVHTVPGLRTGLVVIDDEGYIFTPTALLLEGEERPNQAPNAIRLFRAQVLEVVARLSPAARPIALAAATIDEERRSIQQSAVELPATAINNQNFAHVESRLDEAPPVPFDLARQVRVFSAYVQYVDMNLRGAAIQRQRVTIPSSIQKLGGSEDLEGRLRTTFDLLTRDEHLSSKNLEGALNQIRKDFTKTLGSKHGRVVLKSVKPKLEERLEEFRAALNAHQERVESELQIRLDESREQIINYYLPQVIQSPPDALVGQLLRLTEIDARAWLNYELNRVFPRAEALIRKMHLEVSYKDVTFETLNQDDFLVAIKEAYPMIDWDKAHHEFVAVGEEKKSRASLNAGLSSHPFL